MTPNDSFKKGPYRVVHLLAAMTALCILTASCDKIIEEDINGAKVTVLAPPDNYMTANLTNTFWWDEVEGAIDYKLQIVSPSFDSIQKLVIDSHVVGDRIDITLQPGVYQWRIRAENGSYQTPFVTRNITIDSTENISGITLQMNSPSDNLITDSMTITFDWQRIYAAGDYRFQIAKPDFSSAANTFYDVTVTEDSLQYTFINNGVYRWRVRGQNATTNTLYSMRTITIDTVAPSPPLPLTPVHNASALTLPVSLTWSRDNDVKGDSLFIYHPDSLTLLTGYPRFVAGTGENFDHTSADSTYFWKLRSVDGAGHVSGYSSLFKFFAQ